MLKGKNVNLRLTKESDLEKINELMSDLMNRGDYYPMGLHTLVAAKKGFSENGFWGEDMGWLVITDKSDEMLGNIGFFKYAPYADGYELGAIIFNPENRAKGYMTEALKIFIAYMFEIKKIERLQAALTEGNKGSEGVFRKCGLTKEGVMRKAIYHRGQYKNLVLYSILRNEAKSLKETIETL